MHPLPGRPRRGHFRWRSRPRQGCALRCSPGPLPSWAPRRSLRSRHPHGPLPLRPANLPEPRSSQVLTPSPPARPGWGQGRRDERTSGRRPCRWRKVGAPWGRRWAESGGPGEGCGETSFRDRGRERPPRGGRPAAARFAPSWPALLPRAPRGSPSWRAAPARLHRRSCAPSPSLLVFSARPRKGARTRGRPRRTSRAGCRLRAGPKSDASRRRWERFTEWCK